MVISVSDYFIENIETIDIQPSISKFYNQISDEYKIDKLDISLLGERTKAVWNKLVENFELYYNYREISGVSEYDFFCIMQSCLNRNADTYERQLEVYDDDIAKPILGRTEEVIYDVSTTDDRNLQNNQTINTQVNENLTQNNISHHVEVPADSPDYDVDRTRDKDNINSQDITSNTGTIGNNGSENRAGTQKGTVTTKLSDLGVRPNYEMLNGFLENNMTYIEFFLRTFKPCFVPNYRRVLI